MLSAGGLGCFLIRWRDAWVGRRGAMRWAAAFGRCAGAGSCRSLRPAAAAAWGQQSPRRLSRQPPRRLESGPAPVLRLPPDPTRSALTQRPLENVAARFRLATTPVALVGDLSAISWRTALCRQLIFPDRLRHRMESLQCHRLLELCNASIFIPSYQGIGQ